MLDSFRSRTRPPKCVRPTSNNLRRIPLVGAGVPYSTPAQGLLPALDASRAKRRPRTLRADGEQLSHLQIAAHRDKFAGTVSILERVSTRRASRALVSNGVQMD